jgi:single-stranded-DNA-specific exonuclease
MLQIRVKQSAQETQENVSHIASAVGVSELCARVLIRRGIADVDSAQAFIRADTFYDPFLLDGMAEAVALIRDFVSMMAPITVYGDYDCDGTSACAILYSAFRDAGTDIDVYIPSRHSEGYGLNEDAVRTIAKRGGLLITVDCGITNQSEVALARSLGLNVIVTDHHQPYESKPEAICINPPTSPRYPFRQLCGAGIALKIVHALFGEKAMASFVDFAAIATVCDLVPLIGENRAIVKAGLRLMAQRPRTGIAALAKVAGIADKKLSAGQIAFLIGPRINAAGRMGDATRAFRLLTTIDEGEAASLAQELDKENRDRQSEEQVIVREAEALLGSGVFSRLTAVVFKRGWHHGVIGIVASRLVELYGRPSAVICVDDDNTCTGSARGIPGANIFSALCECAPLLTRYGGHELAGGFSLPAHNLQAFCDAFEQHFATAYPKGIWARAIDCDLEVCPNELNAALAKDLERLTPFGIGNPAPSLLLASMTLVAKNAMGRTDEHLRLTLEKDGVRTEGLLFRARQFDLPETMSVCDFVGSLDTDSYNGVERARFLIRALRPDIRRFADMAEQAGGLFGYGFARSCLCLEKRLTLTEAAERVASSPFGLRLDVHCPLTLKRAFADRCDEQTLALLEPYMTGIRNGIHGRNALVIAPQDALVAGSASDNGSGCGNYDRFRLDSDENIMLYARLLFLERESMAALYRVLINRARQPLPLIERCKAAAQQTGHPPDCAGMALAVFEELGFLDVEPMVLTIKENNEKRLLDQSERYRAIARLGGGEV